MAHAFLQIFLFKEAQHKMCVCVNNNLAEVVSMRGRQWNLSIITLQSARGTAMKIINVGQRASHVK